VIVAVLDTNTIVSGMLAPLGIPKRLLDAAKEGHFTLCSGTIILHEVFTTLGRDRITRKYRLSGSDLQRLRDLLEHETIPTPVTIEVHGVASHPKDDLVLATAVSGRADYLVTGDSQLQKLKRYKGVSIVSPREFLDILDREQSRRNIIARSLWP
jgi:putative PIN family toxin of toxin-antitoxin system